MRILICGDRHWDDRETIRKYLKTLSPGTVIIEGEAPGADTIAKEEAEKLGLGVLKYEAKWARYGRSAGPIRNLQMITEGKPDLVVAFHNNIEKSKGTKDMLKQAEAHKIPTRLLSKSGQIMVDVTVFDMSHYYPKIITTFEPMKVGPTLPVEDLPDEHRVKDHYGSQPKPKRLYRLVEDQLTVLHDWDEDQAKVLTLWREAHRAKPGKYHEVFVTEKDGGVHGLCQLKPGECSRGIKEHDLSCEECDNYKRIEDKVRCQELYIAGWKGESVE